MSLFIDYGSGTPKLQHVHPQLDTLNKLTELDGKLLFDGKPISTASDVVSTPSGSFIIQEATTLESIDKNKSGIAILTVDVISFFIRTVYVVGTDKSLKILTINKYDKDIDGNIILVSKEVDGTLPTEEQEFKMVFHLNVSIALYKVESLTATTKLFEKFVHSGNTYYRIFDKEDNPLSDRLPMRADNYIDVSKIDMRGGKIVVEGKGVTQLSIYRYTLSNSVETIEIVKGKSLESLVGCFMDMSHLKYVKIPPAELVNVKDMK